MKTWTVSNQKGGVGKTTTVVSLAGWMAERGLEVLVVDMDPQASLTGYFGVDGDGARASVYDLFMDQAPKALPELTCDSGVSGITLAPASSAMATLDRQLGAKKGQGLVLAAALAGVADRYEHVLVDCPPTLGVLMINALAAGDRLLLPVQTEHLAIKGLERMLRTLEMVNRSRTDALNPLIIPCMFDRRTRAAVQSLDYLRDTYAEMLWNEVIPIDTQFREASKLGVPISGTTPSSRGARAYLKLLEDLTEVRAEHHAIRSAEASA